MKKNTGKQIIIRKYIKDGLYLIVGCFLMAIGTSLFLLPNKLSSGGFAGISTIIYYLFNIPLGTTMLLLNIPLLILTIIRVGKETAIKGIIGTIVLSSFIDNLQISRMQRDLSDSSMLRNIGLAIAYTLISIKQTIIGINKLRVNKEFLEQELDNNPEILSEAIQTILRKNGNENGYELLKELTRGKKVTLEELRDFIQKLEIDENDKERLLKLKPQDYIGLAEEIAKNLL